MRALILNRGGGELPEDNWYQIEVTGEHPAGAGRVQVIDAEAVGTIVAQFNRRAEGGWAGMLIDADHLSHDLDQKTEAYGWLQELRERNGQIEGRIEWTDIGEAAIRNKRYKFFSTEYDAQDLEVIEKGKVRPVCLSGLALTNRPNNKGGRPISNRDAEGDEFDDKSTNNDMKTLAEKLGLAPEATEDEILAKVGKLQARVSELENKEADAEAEEILNRHAKKFPAGQRENWKKQLLANREGTEELLAGLAEPEKKPDTTPIKNRVTSPEPVSDGGGKSDGVAEKEARQIRNRAQELKNQNPNRDYGECWDQAEGEISKS
ncbi:phage protease [Rubritalea spongiae]|uniref:Phage protease n=1 Tax=Rubritalea spongiae TaxID=430797 RepID=A0ABW5E218_9BACT